MSIEVGRDPSIGRLGTVKMNRRSSGLVVPEWVRILHSDPVVTYGGTWTTSGSCAPDGFSGTQIAATTEWAEISVEGPAEVQIVYPKSSNGRTVQVIVDGMVVQTFSQQDSSFTCGHVVGPHNVGVGEHTVRIQRTDVHLSGWMRLQAFEVFK